MAKNVIIAEGSTGRRMPDVQKILTLRPTTGSDLWVPVDERLSRTKYITKNGTYYATEDELYAFSKVTVNVPGGVQGVTTPTVTVGLSNTSPDAIPDINPYTGLQNDVSISVEQPDTLTSPTAMPQAIGVPGSTISGIDPETGDTVTIGLDGNGNIVTERDEVPYALMVWRKPDKVSYNDGDTINYSGITCRLMTSSGAWYNKGNYTEEKQHLAGKVPFNELVFPVTVARYADSTGDGGYHSDYDTVYVSQPIPVNDTISFNTYQNNRGNVDIYIHAAEGSKLIIWESDTVYNSDSKYTSTGYKIYAISKNSNPRCTIWRVWEDNGQIDTLGPQGWSTGGTSVSKKSFNGTTYYFREAFSDSIRVWDNYPSTRAGHNDSWYSGVSAHKGYLDPSSDDWKLSTVYDAFWNDLGSYVTWVGPILATVLDGGYVEANILTLPVQWNRDDGETLSTSFEVTVTQGSSDDGGYSGSGGGSF